MQLLRWYMHHGQRGAVSPGVGAPAQVVQVVQEVVEALEVQKLASGQGAPGEGPRFAGGLHQEQLPTDMVNSRLEGAVPLT